VDERVRTEEYQIDGDKLVASIKELIHQGNIRRVIIKNEEGLTLIEIPLTLGVIGAALLPVWAALGALAALVARFTIVVEKVEGPTGDTA
jgi:competence protein ComGC